MKLVESFIFFHKLYFTVAPPLNFKVQSKPLDYVSWNVGQKIVGCVTNSGYMIIQSYSIQFISSSGFSSFMQDDYKQR